MLAALALILLAFAGYIKGVPAISQVPVDLTFVGAALTGLLVGNRIFVDRRVPSVGSAGIFILGLAFVVGVAGADWGGLGAEKVLKLFLLSGLSACGALVLLRNSAARRSWLVLVIVLGLVVAALGFAFPNQEVSEFGRLAVEGNNTIGSGRAIGAGAVVLSLLGLNSQRARYPFLALAVVLTALAFITGSRGPVLAIIIATVGATALSPVRQRILRIALAVGAVLLSVLLAFRADLVSSRLLSLDDNSADTRRQIWAESSALIGSNPLGIGWGNFGAFVQSGTGQVSAAPYSHNILLEITVESGWLAGGVFIFLLVTSLRSQVRAAATAQEIAMLGLFLFFLVNATVSGDVIDNRGVWVAMGAALAVHAGNQSEHDPLKSRATHSNSLWFGRSSLV